MEGLVPQSPTLKYVRTPVLEIAFEESGPVSGAPVLLMHGFPYDPRTYDDVVPGLVAAGCRVIVPYLRGYGPTRFLSQDTLRSGQQAALGKDLLDFLDALDLKRATLVGYDWGGRAACIIAALWPERVQGLMSGAGYNIQNIAASVEPAEAEQEFRYWYQYYFNTPRGQAGLEVNRREICRLLWRLWSPNWQFDDATFARTAASFDNPDFVEVVIHSYRHRYGYVAGDPALEEIEQRLAAHPAIRVPTVVLHGVASGVGPPTESDPEAHLFTGSYRRQLIPRVGHNIPAEAPQAVIDAVRELTPTS
jgi:pimeloyl-ACP methyl ester carboxylesterase